MLLNDIGKSPDASFRKINQHLELNYGFKISESVSDKDLIVITEQIEEEITELKLKGDDAKASPEISKRLLVLEAIKNLREYTMLQFQSPKLEKVIGDLTDFVVDTFEISGMETKDLDEALNRAMDEYRSSKYRFPDEAIRERVLQNAIQRIHAASNLSSDEPAISFPVSENILDSDKTDQLTDVESLTDAKDDIVPMISDKNGRIVPDPFAAQAAARRKGIVMKENLVKRLRTLLETEVSQAEVMMASKGFAQELQEMIEKIGRLQNEDLPPVTDQMRETYGVESSMAFQTQISGALQSVMDSLYSAKSQVDDAVSNMAATGQVTAAVDMDKDIAAVADKESSMDADLDNIAADLGADMEDEFGAEDSDEPLGRAKKAEESVQLMKNKIIEMQRLVEKARKLREARKQ